MKIDFFKFVPKEVEHQSSNNNGDYNKYVYSALSGVTQIAVTEI